MTGAATATTTHADFFAALFPDPDGLIELRALPSKARDFFRPCDSEGIERFVRAHPQQNIFFGVATRKSHGSGKLENCGLLYALFADIDFKVIPESEARARLSRFLLSPSIIVCSGGGLHVYYLLREPLDLQAEAAKARFLLRRLALELGGDLSSAELARVLRLPHTLNHKPEYGTPRPVLIEVFEPERQYNPSDFDDVLPEEPEPTANSNGHEQRADWLTLLQGVPQGGRYGIATRIAGHFLGIGRSVEEVETLILGYLSQCNPPGDTEEREKARRMVRDFAAKDAATGDNNSADPLTAIRALPDEPSPEAVEAALRGLAATLAGADPLRRERVRVEAVTILKSKKVASAARFIDAAFGMAKATPEAAANAIFLVDPEPWPEPVDGAALLKKIEAVLNRYVWLPLEAAVAVTLWVLFAHGHESFDVSPILAATSATKRCGKTLLEQIVGAMVPRALMTSNISPAALFRAIEAYRPTLLIDEGDAFLTFSEELRGILNSGHTRRGAIVVRCDGDPIEARTFSTWTPKVVALIGALPGTVADRSVVIRMERKGRGEAVERFRSSFLAKIDPLCRQAARWAADNLAHLKTIDPAVPDSLNDRAADNWRPLLAIADLAGGEWPKAARKAALTLSGKSDAEDEGHGVTLIGDIVTIFNEGGKTRLSSTELIEELVKIEARPWNEWTRGKSITPRGLARLLKPFGIKPEVEQLEDKRSLRGYMLKDFVSVHSRYYGNLSVDSVDGEQNQVVSHSFLCVDNPSFYGYENDVTTEKHKASTLSTDRIPESGGKREIEMQPGLFEEDDPGLLATRPADVEELNPAWGEVDV